MGSLGSTEEKLEDRLRAFLCRSISLSLFLVDPVTPSGNCIQMRPCLPLPFCSKIGPHGPTEVSPQKGITHEHLGWTFLGWREASQWF